MKALDAVKARLGSIPPDRQRLILSASPAAHRLLFEDLPTLVKIAELSSSLLSELRPYGEADHFVVARILANKLEALE